MRISEKLLVLLPVVLLSVSAPARRVEAQVVISEFLALNDSGLVDADGDASDWIELLNLGARTVDLGGWHLTDRSLETRWTLPLGVELAPGDFLIVFASEKNRATAGAELHTSFALSGDGEYLALLRPDGRTIEYEYAPTFPPQRSDISYGLTQDVQTTTLVARNASVAYLVPADGSAGASWTLPEFDETGWTAGTLGIGFETADDNGGEIPAEIVNLAPNGIPSQSSTLSGYTADLAIDGDFGNFTHTQAGVNLPATWELDLGGTHAIESIVLHNRTGCCGSRLRDIRVSILDATGGVKLFESELLNPENILGQYPNGPPNLMVDLVELTGGMVRGEIVRIVRIPDPDLSGTNGEGRVSEPDVLQLGEVEVFGHSSEAPPGFGDLVQSDVEAAMHGENASIFVRVPFEITADAEFQFLRLRVRYDDGFVAYLNGVEVASRNAPAVPTWSSAATQEHPDEQAIVVEEINLSANLDLLQKGANVLAVHGMNVAPDDTDFLLAPELVGESVIDDVLRYFTEPTPGAANSSPAILGFVEGATFSVPRGFYEHPFQVHLTSATEGARIRYTLDGSAPGEDSGSLYDEPILVETTTTLRAVALKPGFLPSAVATHSYLFLADVIRQPMGPPGFPATWGSVTADYDMDPDVVDDPLYRDEILDGLRSIRTLSVVVDQDDFFNAPRGIYANPRGEGVLWERPVSVEFLHPEASQEDVQVNCGIRLHGNGSRSPTGNPKHTFRLEFRGRYGTKSLTYPLFPGSRVEEFDSLILRGQNAHGWTRSSQIANNVGTTEREQSQYIRDSFARDLHTAMGNVGGGATYVHLYINGLYWGLYNPVEYPRAFFGASHFGGEEEEYDAINRRPVSAGGEGTHAIDGTKEAWEEMQRLADSGLTTPQAYEATQQHIDVDNMIDYMLVHQYMGSRDGPEVFHSNNMRAVRRSRGPGDVPWKCMLWDMEASMFEIDVTRNVNVDDPDTIVRVYTQLRRNPEFVVRYGDRVHRHCFHGGALTPEATEATWEARAEEIYTAILGESARWGDTRRAVPFTRDAEWMTERNRLLTTYFPTRTAFLVDLLRRNGLYPRVDPPLFSRHGGHIERGFELFLTAQSGAAYYTVDGSDPRLPGGDLAPTAFAVGEARALTLVDAGVSSRVLVPENGTLGLDWIALDFDDAGWRSGHTGVGYERGVGYEDDLRTDVETDMYEVNASVYVRVPFSADEPENLAVLTLRLKYDDGFVAYLNGQFVASRNAPGSPRWDSEATGGHEARDFEDFDLSESLNLLRSGDNILAIHGLNAGTASGDMLILPFLVAAPPAAETGIVLDRTTKVGVRALVGDEWSALDEAVFAVDSSALRITEMMYHPAPPPPDSPFTTEDFEFIEMQNTGGVPLNLTAILLADGVEFAFPDGDALPAEDLQPGQVALVVKNLEAFRTRYDTEELYIAGEYRDRLSNVGERVLLLDRLGTTILDFVYSDDWFPLTDGLGSSLEIRDPTAAPETWANPESWQPSVSIGGSPGVVPALPTPGGQIVGDINQDRSLDLSDAVALLTHLFIAPRTLPCSPEGNEKLLDFNGDGGVNISDAVNALVYLFNAGSPPPLGTGCVVVEGCPEACSP